MNMINKKINVGVGASTTRNQRGITLIALIITIIVLLILAGVSISLLTGQDSIIGKAKQAKNEYEAASQNEADTINGLFNLMDGGTAPNGIQQIDDGTGATVPVPVGFRHIEGTKATGFVIQNDTDGNEFVWIPTDLITGGYATKDWSKGHAASDYTEYYTSNTTDNASIISAITTSVNENNGYYISRYEAGTTTQRTSEGQELTTVVSKATSLGTQVYAYNYVTWDQAISLAEGLYNKAQHNVESRLINSRGWDTALKFIEQVDSSYPTNSAGKGWYSNNYSAGNSNFETGKPVGTSANMVRNIYDMAGNMYEWTADQYTSNTDSRANRGAFYGYAGSNFPAAYRDGNLYDSTLNYVGFRLALYL